MNKSIPTQQFSFKASNIEMGLVLAIHCVACLSVLLTFLSIYLKLSLTLTLFATLILYFKQYESAYQQLQFGDKGWSLINEEGEQNAMLQGEIYCSPVLIIMHFKLQSGGKKVVRLFPDSADADTLRKLRVVLRHQSAKAQAI